MATYLKNDRIAASLVLRLRALLPVVSHSVVYLVASGSCG